MDQRQPRYWTKNNVMQIHVFKKKSSPIDITRKNEKLCTVAFNRIFDYDDVINMKNKYHISCRELSQLQHIKNLGENWWPVSEIISIEQRQKWRHQKKKKKKKNFEFRCQYDDFVSLCTSQGGMKSYLQLMLFPSMI